MMSEKPSYLADFDSSSAMLAALGRFLHGRDFPMLGAIAPWAMPAVKALSAIVNRLPSFLEEQVYIWSGWLEAIASRRLDRINDSDLARWAVSQYPKRRYSAVAIGSSNGAATHLWAALGIPWLPQTFLVPVARSGVHPDEPNDELRWSLEPARRVLERNPHLQLHHMHDPVQDRLMVRRMSYFRFKKLSLGDTYRTFLDQCLEPGGTIVLVDCRLSWPVTDCGGRHLFQFGALGGATQAEMHRGGPRVAEYLRRHGSHRTKWDPPAPDLWAPEAEWGFVPSLGDDVSAYAAERGFSVRRLVFEQPESMSPLVADLHRWWNERRGLSSTRLLVDSFILMEPYWCLRTGSIPFWMVFNTEGSFAALQSYLGTRVFDEIYATLFSHGVNSIGLPSIADWRALIEHASTRSKFIGVDQAAFPRDFAVYGRYHDDLLRAIPHRHVMPPSLTLAQFDQFLQGHRQRYDVEWIQDRHPLAA
ncbi:MAG TPA: hypothetical protein VJR03_05340 [Nitrospira sp.]|nr:hypothetical protein [Nitrospira sp.]